MGNSLREWYGLAYFNHPSPASLDQLQTHFPTMSLDDTYDFSVLPHQAGETIAHLHDRVAFALNHIINFIDAEIGDKKVSMLICTHAATLIAIGRTLTGFMPDDPNQDDFFAPTAGITKFVRKEGPQQIPDSVTLGAIPVWKGRGIAGGWTCIMNGNCDHLAGGAERSW